MTTENNIRIFGVCFNRTHCEHAQIKNKTLVPFYYYRDNHVYALLDRACLVISGPKKKRPGNETTGRLGQPCTYLYFVLHTKLCC